jgi:hypothetical protein
MTNAPPPPAPDQNLLNRWTLGIALLIFGALLGGIFVLLRETGRDLQPADLGSAFEYDVDHYKVISPDRIGYREIARIDTGLARVTALAVGAAGRVLVGGDEEVRVFLADGNREDTIPVGETPFALFAPPGGELFVATKNRVGRSTDLGAIEWILTVLGERARITSVAADGEYIFIADAGSRGVWRFAVTGEPRGRIGDRDEDRNIPGFAVPSAFFDLLIAPDGLLRIVDPGRHQIRAFTRDGDLELSWGTASFNLEGFSGCCNPSHLAMLPDGSFVTSEKGIPRVKVYDADGGFLTAVVGADGLGTDFEPCDVATDRKGRIYVLDPGEKVVRIFESEGGADGDD